MKKKKNPVQIEEKPKILIPGIKNMLRMIVSMIIASVLLSLNINLYIVDLVLTILMVTCFAILRDLSQSTHIYGDFFKDVTTHQVMLSVLIYLGGVFGPGIFYLVQYIMTKI